MLHSVGIRFVPGGRESIDLFDVRTGERLRTGLGLKAAAEAEAQRADKAEAAVQELLARIALVEKNQ